MEYQEFYEISSQELKEMKIDMQEYQIKNLYTYMKLLLEKNQKMNLTAITKPEEIITKHFLDSLSICHYLDLHKEIIDVGTGAGFPGLPIAIMREDLKMFLLDTLKKRVDFLDTIKMQLKLSNVKTIWGRVEDIAHKEEYREKFDYAVSRAVAPLNILLEYMLPLIKVGGMCICMKGPNIQDESLKMEHVIELLGGKLIKIDEIKIKENIRNIILIQKIKNTNEKYPRKAGIPTKKPLT